MNWRTTRVSLLSRLRGTHNDEAWREFDARYGFLIVRYCHSRGLQFSDAEDVRQIVMLNLAKGMAGFRYDPDRGRFRSYLGRVIRNAITRYCTAPARVNVALTDRADVLEEATGTADEPDERWDREWILHHYRLALQSLQESCDPRVLRAFYQLLDGATIHETARDNKMSVEGVYKIRQRIRERLRAQVEAQIRQEEREPFTPTGSC